MSKATLIATLMAIVSAFSSAAKTQAPLKTKPSAKSDQPTYMITAHVVVHDDSTNSQLDNYVIVYESEVLSVQYAESQISTVKPGASELEQVAPGKNLHWHTRYGRWPQEPDVSQVPHIGVPIRACEMDTEYPDNDGHPVIAIQSVSAPCMSRDGDTLHYAIAPNGGIKMLEYVNFDILEATNNVGVVAAQSAPPRKDIPAIAKAANGSIVSIVMSDKDGKRIAQGSGFVVSKDGVIVTNYHVISEGSSAIVKLPDGAFYDVDGVLAFDKTRDVAVIKAHGENFRTLTLGNSDRVQVGEEVVAIGNPLSLESTVSNGIVSGIRTAEEHGGKFLQVTAPISPGSSGGPLFNMKGEVVGITTLYLEGGENLNFAIPINDAKRLLLLNSSKLQNLPNETGLVEAPTHNNNENVPATPIARDYYEHLHNAGGFSNGVPRMMIPSGKWKVTSDGRRIMQQDVSYVCFNDDAHSDTFFTFNATGYDENFSKADAKFEDMVMQDAREEVSGKASVSERRKLDAKMQEQSKIMEELEQDYHAALPYVRLLSSDEVNGYPPEYQRFVRGGGRSLIAYLYERGVKVGTIVYSADLPTSKLEAVFPTSVGQIMADSRALPADPNAYTTLRLSIEPTTMRYIITAVPTVGSTGKSTTDIARYGGQAGRCEQVTDAPEPK